MKKYFSLFNCAHPVAPSNSPLGEGFEECPAGRVHSAAFSIIQLPNASLIVSHQQSLNISRKVLGIDKSSQPCNHLIYSELQALDALGLIPLFSPTPNFNFR